MVPGVGDGTNLCDDWIPEAREPLRGRADTAVVLWKGYDNPADILAAAAGSIECSEDLIVAASDLTAFVARSPLRHDQSLTVVAHSFGSIVTGAALADCGLQVTDVVVAGSPGMTVDDLRQLHVEQSHFFSEQAPGDAVAELGIFGASPSSPTFGGTRMSTNAPGTRPWRPTPATSSPAPRRSRTWWTSSPGYAEVVRHRSAFPEIAGGLVAWVLRMPAVPVRIAGRHYRGPGFRLLTNWCRLVDLGASETGNLVVEVLDESERARLWVAHRVGALPEEGAPAPASRAGEPDGTARTRLRPGMPEAFLARSEPDSSVSNRGRRHATFARCPSG